VHPGIEKIEDELAPILQMSVHIPKTGNLIVNVQQVLERTKRKRGQSEFLVEAEVLHRGLHQADPFAHFFELFFQSRLAHPQHLVRGVEPGDLHARPRRGNEHAACAAAQFQHRPRRLLGGIHVELNVRPIAIGIDEIVALGDKWVSVGDLVHAALRRFEEYSPIDCL
jgi:hypothetical protein